MNKITHIAIHCSDSDWGDVGVIRDWHVNGNGWRDVGYNFIITNGHFTHRSGYEAKKDGVLQVGRNIDHDVWIDSAEQGAHVLGYNSTSIGICMIGKDQFTVKQFRTLITFINYWQNIYPDIKLYGHYEFDSANGKTCPNFDVSTLRKFNLYNIEEQILFLSKMSQDNKIR